MKQQGIYPHGSRQHTYHDRITKISRSSRAARSTLNTSSRENMQSTAHSLHVHLNNRDSRKNHAAHTTAKSSSTTTHTCSPASTNDPSFLLTRVQVRVLYVSCRLDPSRGPRRTGPVIQALWCRFCRARRVVQARQPRDVAQGCSLQRPAVAVVPVKVLLCVPRGLSRGFRSGAVQTLCDGRLCYEHGLGFADG